MDDCLDHASPEEQSSAATGVNADEVSDDNECSEGRQIFYKVEVCALGSLGPNCRGWWIFRVVENWFKSLALNSFKYVRQPKHDAKERAPS